MWSIEELENTLVIPKKLAKKLNKELVTADHFQDGDEPIVDGRLYFNGDHMEHMDYLWNEDIQAVLKKHKLKGRICFGSLEGDNAGKFWGYEFDGKGGMVELEGTLSWAPKK